MLELYHHGSSACAAKVRFALAEKQLAWTGHYIDLLKGEQFAPEFLAINPKGVVPVLVHDGGIIPESTVHLILAGGTGNNKQTRVANAVQKTAVF